MKRIFSKSIGQAMIEFALILPLLMLIVIGILELSLLLYDKAVITNASREGARYGVTLQTPSYPTSTQVINYTKTYTTNRLVSFAQVAPTVTVTATSSTNPPVFGSKLTVVVSYTYTDLVLHHLISHSQLYTISATTVMTYE